jgi:ATP-dependent Clp protease ATP-binding subunit ClpA
MFERFTDDARAAIVLAQEEARELAASHIGTEHLLSGVLRAAGRDLSAVLSGFGLTLDAVRDRLVSTNSDGEEPNDEDAEALRTLGIDLSAVRDSVARTFGADAFDHALRRSGRRLRRPGRIPFALASKTALELALREALARKDKEIRCEYLILGILRGEDPAAITLITEHLDTAQLRAALIALLDKAA